ncbi:MAG TPA: YciI family protein [Nitriliruptorales bacterium]|nr:YciI family protein [Nitriliruptorales bacterium]
MAQYLLSAHSVEGQVRQPMTEEQVAEVTRKVLEMEAEMRSTGVWVFAGRLHPPETATVVRVSDGDVFTTDGPFAESKEHLGGFYVIDVEDLDEALQWARRTAETVNTPIEVRPFADYPEG